MQFSDQQLLDVWERGQRQPLLQAGLLLLQLCYPALTPEELLDFTIGERDRALLQLRRHCFGEVLESTATCPECGQEMEWETTVEAFVLQPLWDPQRPKWFELEHGQQIFNFRLPTSRDILKLSNAERTVQRFEDHLLTLCLAKPEVVTDPPPSGLPEALGAAMAHHDAQTDIRLQLECANCQHNWSVSFDILSYLWEELNAWAISMIRAISLLARVYGWSERDILAMSRFRRNLYLQMIPQ